MCRTMECSMLLSYISVFVTGAANGPQARVANGREAGLGEFPWMVIILKDNSPQCGGTIISPTGILTAAHCVLDENPYKYLVVAGSLNWKDTQGDFYAKRQPSYTVAAQRLQAAIRMGQHAPRLGLLL